MSPPYRSRFRRFYRTAARAALHRASTLRGRDGAPRDIVLHDLSATGCRVSGLPGAARYDAVMIGLTGLGGRPARVIWIDGDQAGCHFDEPLTEKEVALARQGGKVIEARFPQQAASSPESTTDAAVAIRSGVGAWIIVIAILTLAGLAGLLALL